MEERPSAVVVFAVVLVSAVFVTGTAGALSVSVAEGESDITVEVTEGGEPVADANVTVSGVTGETPLDGRYETNQRGTVVFGDGKTSELSGIVHLRVTVESPGSYKSVLTTFARGPDAESSPIGHRMSMSLQESVASTHGKVVGRLNAAESGRSEVRATAERVDTLLSNLSETEFRREVLGRDLAAGEISASKFYLEAVKNARRSSTLRGALEENVDRLSSYGDERLRKEGVNPDAVGSLHERLRQGRSVDTDARLIEE